VEIYRPGAPVERYEGVQQVPLDPELPGFTLELEPLFE
jgi:hypothetical protein